MSELLAIDGVSLVKSIDDDLKSLFAGGTLRCRWCGARLSASNFQFIGFNGGVLRTKPWLYHEVDFQKENPHLSKETVWPPYEQEYPHVYCGCGDACLARDMNAGYFHLQKAGVL